MAQHIRLAGWLDPESPASRKNGSLHEFRLKLSEIPLASWKNSFAELGREQKPGVSIEQDVLITSCELADVEGVVGKIKQRVLQTNELVSRLERETDERVARQMQKSQELKIEVLAAVRNIHFDAA